MVPDQLKEYYRQALSVLPILRTAFLVTVIVLSVFYPMVATSGAIPSNTPPESCVENPDRTTTDTDNALISATAAQSDRSNDVVNISYDLKKGDHRLTLDIPAPSKVVETSGFRDYQFSSGDLIANASADEHWITYRTDLSRVKQFDLEEAVSVPEYPSTNDSVVTLIPDHSRNVSLEPAESGYVGSNTLYLGELETESRTVGCQELVIVEIGGPSATVDTSKRLDYLETAARSIEGGQHYETVTVFMTTSLYQGDQGGFVYDFENDILISDVAAEPQSFLIWIHEYTHTLQNYRAGTSMDWTYEGMAEYLSYKVALENDLITPLHYDSELANGRGGTWNMTLDQATRQKIAYKRGAAVFAQIDHDLEGSNKSIYDVIQWLNSQYNPSYDELKQYLETDGNVSASTVDTYDGMILETKPVGLANQSWLSQLLPRVLLSGIFGLLIWPIRVILGGMVLWEAYTRCKQHLQSRL